MKLLEYEAKAILRRYDVPTPRGRTGSTEVSDVGYPLVVKSQVPIGGRGKAGGVVMVKNEAELQQATKKLSLLEIHGFIPHTLLYEEAISIKRELYLSLVIDKRQAGVECVANTRGGVDVEENSQESFLRVVVGRQKLVGGSSYVVGGEETQKDKKDNGTGWDEVGQQLADYLDLPEQTFVLQELLQKLYRGFIEQDMTLLEINPLILSDAGDLVAGDCKMELDDAAQFRHPDWQFEAPAANVNFVTLNKTGNVATIANGAGLAMATVDAVADFGMSPANFLDIGGGASEASITAAFETIMTYQNIQAIIINIFAGITRCDEVARAIVAAKQTMPDLPPLFIRLTGTNAEEARTILDEAGVPLLDTLPACLSAAHEVLR